MKRPSTLAIVLLTIALCGAPAATAGFFVLPYDAEVFLQPAGGEAAATTEFGYLTPTGNLVPLFEGLPNMPNPDHAVDLGFFTGGTGLDFYEKTEFGGMTYFAYSNAHDQASLVAFTDIDNSLGMGGSVIQQTGTSTWLFHLDDAASYLFDDDDNDVHIQLQLQVGFVPEPEGLPLLSIGIVTLLAHNRIRHKTRRKVTRSASADSPESHQGH